MRVTVIAVQSACIFRILLLVFSPEQFYLHNHLSFILYFHKEKLEQGEVHNYRVVRFEVIPQSVKVDGRCQHNLSELLKVA